MRIRARAAALALASIVHVAHSGCGTPGSLPPRPSAETIEHVRALAVRPIKAPSSTVDTSTHQRCATAASTAGSAAQGGLKAGTFIWRALFESGGGYMGDGAILLLFLLALPLVLAPAFALVGAVFGGLAGLASSTALPPEERAALEKALDSSDLPGQVTDLLVERLGGSEALVLSEEGTADAILEIGAPGIILWGAAGKDAPVRLTVLLPVRLLDESGVLYEAEVPFHSDPRPLSGWIQGIGTSIPPLARSAAPALVHRTLLEIFAHHPALPALVEDR